ncbi:hypothetical protein E5676_scaffold172G00220 [Cucumis melo var. makuwa]|uniref:Uncharacterized protein n=1 Tax=Cucumis melo var. makuwa TaxID=1194695 RepID=A0A5D3E6R5_CUCMM|nr:hypothetical protein E6C27_scaffold4741G00040 [Cucumis melo var. makuwa]TYK31539.1 hypothetical protein E5676_scaffold172G00220 [Cucumis melo var. makuwa]
MIKNYYCAFNTLHYSSSSSTKPKRRNPSKLPPLLSPPVVVVDRLSQNNRADRHPAEPSPSIERLFSRQPSRIGSRPASHQPISFASCRHVTSRRRPLDQPHRRTSRAGRQSPRSSVASCLCNPSHTAVPNCISALRKPEQPTSTRVEPHIRRVCTASRATPAPEPSHTATLAFKSSRFLPFKPSQLQPSSRANSCPSTDSCFSSRADLPVLEPSACSDFLHLFWTSLLGKRIFLLLELVEKISRFATDQYVLGAPSGHRRPDSVPTGAHVARVQERASKGRGKGKGKLASDQK